MPAAPEGATLIEAFETLRLERCGATARVVLSRPEARNSLSPGLIRDMGKALDKVEASPELRSLVFTGAGPAFCAGGDLKEVQALSTGEQPARATSAYFGTITALLTRIEAFPLPTIAAVNGVAIAGGLELVLCCDIVVAAETARFGDGHARYGLLPGGGGPVRLPRRIGLNRAKYLMLTADTVSAATMMEWGLVVKTVEDGHLDDAAAELARSLAEKSPLGLARMKALLHDGLEQPADVALRAEQLACLVHAGSLDMAEGLQAFSHKRTPRFTGS